MNWLPNDRATWGIVLAIAAIVLAIPFSLIANLITPKIRNWWAERSVAALKRRIAELERRLKMVETYDLLSESEEVIMVTLQRAGRVIDIGINSLIGGWVGHEIFRHPRSASTIIVLSLIFVVTSILVAAFVLEPIQNCLRMRSSATRRKLREDILRLSVKLAGPR
jgi:hypothetical protein